MSTESKSNEIEQLREEIKYLRTLIEAMNATLMLLAAQQPRYVGPGYFPPPPSPYQPFQPPYQPVIIGDPVNPNPFVEPWVNPFPTTCAADPARFTRAGGCEPISTCFEMKVTACAPLTGAAAPGATAYCLNTGAAETGLVGQFNE